ncbi:Mediator of RNA polymerase II transcription subunit 6 [Neolecta irregularis DAH-3]|uniref:Mediator of RNA polymerase II transcription subunit 6 n=1 Tax=Neolecta irregularis (strain DAH-3) TaxID=1198029 RepID=A0A1U7LQJ5_NEOID|nr:Mediator of RNA polymerase II transcription subunit 6 [Neolecta irregularis DAH-3]|eukprot:OLL24935.1 Mediator of RNA polymerase II transcription subunit 6 [Neolecta irregularis DAH-3]
MNQDLSEIQWRMPEWITAMGGLSTYNILEYFSQSPFYDRSSNNQALKMQTQFSDFGDFQKNLLKMKGIEYAVVKEGPEHWIIAKQHRVSETLAFPLTYYFVIWENVYQAPDLHSILSSRMLNTMRSLSQALDEVSSAVQWDARTGYSYKQPKETNAPNQKQLHDDMVLRGILFNAAVQLNTGDPAHPATVPPKQP